MIEWMKKELEVLRRTAAERVLTECGVSMESPGAIVRSGRTLLDLSSNDYLGLARHPAIAEAMREALVREGAGAGASRLISGNRPPYRRLEEELARWHGREAALVFANGYMANVGAIGALVGRGDVVFSDRHNHASIVDGIVLSRAEHARYRHNDIGHLRELLGKFRHRRRKLIVTDSVFSMGGDRARLSELAELRREFGAMLMVDEAHAVGVYGEEGQGLCRELGMEGQVDVLLGTFGKAFGLYGAYVCGSRALVDWLANKARTLIYTTALPPSTVAGVAAALKLAREESWRRERVRVAGRLFRSSLAQFGAKVGDGDSPIVPMLVGDNDLALRISRSLEEEGVWAPAIRPPTVPAGTARIRFSLSAAQSVHELARAVECIRLAVQSAFGEGR